jgi:NADH dehydrogenase
MHILVLGAGYAGVMAALRLARETAAGPARQNLPPTRVTLVNARDEFVERIRLHQVAAGWTAPARPLSAMFANTGIELRVGAVRAIDLAARQVDVAGERIGYDRLVLALGSSVDLESVPGAREHAFTLDPQRAQVLAARMPQLAAAGAKVVIAGNGLTGIEAASELAEHWPGLRVTLVGAGPVAAELSEPARVHVRRQLTAAGIELLESVRVERVTADAVWTAAGQIECDACVWAAGFRAPALARDAGFDVNERGQVRVDACLRSLSHPDVYVAGDLAWLPPELGAPLPMGCKSAGPAGGHVAHNLVRELAGTTPRHMRFRAPAYCMSLGRRDGVLQLRGRDGSMTGPIMTGRLAAYVKELICSGAVWMLRFEHKRSQRRAVDRALAPMAAGG